LASTETATDMVAGDFNGDGKMDLAVSIQNSINTSIVLFSGNGDGTFTRGTTFSIFEPRESATLVSGDFNKDSKLDLAYVNANALYVM